MASRITADTDVNLDFLTKEEREALLSKKMDMIRQRNRLLNERHEMIEADRRKAEESGNAVKALDSKTLPAEGALTKPKGRGRGQGQGPHNKEGNKPNKERPKSHVDAFMYEPIVDVSELTGPKGDHYKNKGKGGQHFQDRDGAPAATPKNRRKPQQKQENPPPDPSFNPLSDRRREGGERKDTPRKDGTDHKRHPRNYGGGADLSKVKDTMKTMREKERERPMTGKPLEMVMTGRERKNHEQWKQERDRYDHERIQRQMGEGGNWTREWDMDKVVLEYDDGPHGRREPAKRPAGRIGSGRFDRGDREERPRPANRDGKGLSPQQSAPTGPINHQQPQSPPQQAPQSPPPSTQPGDGKNPRGKGRGRGRGRSRGGGQGGGPGDKSPRPRTWSGGDDRFVECQKEMLVVKFENTAGDNTVEVEYENGAPMSPTPSSKSSGSTPGRGPTGRTPNQGGGPRSKGGKAQNSKQEKFSKGRIGSGRISGHYQGQDARGQPDQFVDAEWDSPVNHRHSYDGSRVRTSSSFSQSHGDSEEWEDCTESSGAPDEEDLMDGSQNLRLDCPLNPDAPEFLPTSPDFLKTPPGHVKVLNWQGASSNTPPSPHSSVGQPSLSTPSPRQQNNTPNHQSPFSSPGSSASVRAQKRREESDAMPEPDEPMPPPFLLEEQKDVSDHRHRMKNGDVRAEKEAEEDEDEERFEDSIDLADEQQEKVEDGKTPSGNTKETSNAQVKDVPSHDEKPVSGNDPDPLTPEPQPAAGHTLKEESLPDPKVATSNENSEGADKASPAQSGDEVPETTTVSGNTGPQEEDDTPSDPADSREDTPQPDASGYPASNASPKADPDNTSDSDQTVSTEVQECASDKNESVTDKNESATDKPESATDKPESATDKPESATDKPESATDKPESATDKPESATDNQPTAEHSALS